MLPGAGRIRTYLRPDHLHQRADELRSDISVSPKRFFVDDLAHREPQGGLQALGDQLA